MVNYYENHAASLKAIMDSYGSACPVVKWANVDRAVIPSAAKQEKNLGVGGFAVDCDFQFETLVSEFRDTEGQTTAQIKERMLQTSLSYLGVDYKIVSVKIRPGDLQLGVGCNSFNATK